MTMQHSYRFLVATAVWGDKARDNFHACHHPSLHLPGNYECLGSDVVSILYNEKNSIIHQSVSQTLIGMQQRAAKYAFDEDRILIWTYPDTVILPNSFVEIIRHLNNGKRAMLYPGAFLKLSAEEAGNIEHNFSQRDYFIDNKAVMWGLIKKFEHPQMTSRYFSSDTPYLMQNNWPHTVYTDTGNEIVVNAFHCHPVFVWQRADGSVCKTPLDGDFCPHAGLTRRDFAFPENFAMFEWDGGQKLDGTEGIFKTLEDWVNWAKIHVTDFNLETVLTPIVLGRKDSNFDDRRSTTVHRMLEQIVTKTLNTRKREGLTCVTK